MYHFIFPKFKVSSEIFIFQKQIYNGQIFLKKKSIIITGKTIFWKEEIQIQAREN
jgi:hypothetical protein